MFQRLGFRSLAFMGALLMLALTAGAYASMYYWKARFIQQASDDAILGIANDLEIVKRVRDGNAKGAVDLISVDAEIGLLYLLHNDEGGPKDNDFVRRRTVVLTRLREEWVKNTRYQQLGSNQQAPMDAERQKYYQELQAYQDAHAKAPPARPR